jgi:hypothetical protein
VTETRQPTDPTQEDSAEEGIAAAIALILAGQATLPDGMAPAAAIALLLARLPGLLEEGVSAAVAALVTGPQIPKPTGSAAILAARASNISYRAHYAIGAAKRVAAGVGEGKSIAEAVRAERKYLRQHLEASRTRLAGARLNEAAAERWGPILSWNHTGRTETHRPSHVAADGANYRMGSAPAATGGMLPGQAPNCDCIPGPPIPNGRMLT